MSQHLETADKHPGGETPALYVRRGRLDATYAVLKPLILFAVLLVYLTAEHTWAAAVVRIWDGGSATSGNWTSGANWQGNVAPVAGDILSFPAGAARLMNTNNYPTNSIFGRIVFEGDNYNIYGNPVTLTNGLSAQTGAAGNVFRPNIRLGSPMGFSASGPGLGLTVMGAVDLNSHDLGLFATGELHVSGRITGTAGVTKDGSGRVVFNGSGANTYEGDTTVLGGILELNKFILINGFPSPRIAVPGNLIVGGGIGPLIGDAVRCLLHNQIAADAVVTVNQTGELNLNGNGNTIASLRMIGGHVLTGTGTLSVTDSNIVCQRVGSEASDPDGSTISGRLNFVGAGPKFFEVPQSTALLTVSAVVTGAPNATIIKTGEGELRFTSANTYAGATILSQGTLRASANNAFGSGTNGVTVESGEPIIVQGTELILVNAAISGKTLTIKKQGLALSTEGLTSFWFGNVVLENFAMIETRGSSSLHHNGGISGPGGIFKSGPGTIWLGGSVPNTYAGFTRASAGELTLLKSNTVAIPGAMSVGEGAGAAAIVRAVYAGGGGVTPNQIADSAAIEVRVTGELIIQHFERIGSLRGAGILELTSELEVGFNNTSTEFSGDILGPSGELSKIGTGTLTLSGSSASDHTRVQEGALILNGNLTDGINVWAGASLGGNGTIGSYLLMQGGTMNPGGSPGQLTVNGDVQLASAPSVFRFELNSTATTLQDQLVVGGMVNLAGISLEVIPAMAFAPGSQFTIINKQGGMPIASPFEGLPEGATLNAGGQIFQITYQGGNGNDVVLTRGATLISSGLRHTTLGLASLMEGPSGNLIVGNIGSSGDDGVFIPLGDAQGWQGEAEPPDPSMGQGRVTWEILGRRGNLPLQPITRGWMEVMSGEIHAFADSSAVGASAHWVEFFAGEEFLMNALVPSNAPLFRLVAPFTNPPAMTLRCEGPFPGKRYWSSEIIFQEPRRVMKPGGDVNSPLDGVTRIRVIPVAAMELADVGPPFALQLTAKDISEIRIADEALLYPPTPVDTGLPHRALGQARFEPVPGGGHIIVSNVGSSGEDGVSIDVANRSSGLGILTAPISLTPAGTMIALNAVGTFDGMPEHSMGTASLRTVGAAVQAMADFMPVGSSMVRVEIFHGSTMVGSATEAAGMVATIASPIGQGGAPSLDAVGWVPPCLLPVIDGIAQTAFEPLSCYFFHFDGPALFTMAGGEQFVGDSLRLLTANDQPRAQSLARLDIRAALMTSNSSFALNLEKLRLPVPEVTRIFPQQTRAGEIVEIRGRGFGNDPKDIAVVGSTRVAGLDQLTVPFHVLSASDTRILARVGHMPPGTPSGPIQVYRGVGNEGTPQGIASDVEFTKPIRAWMESTPPAYTLEAVYQPEILTPPGRQCFQSGPPIQGILCVYLYDWFPNVVVSFSSHVSAAFASGSASVDASGVRFLGGGDSLDGAQRLANVLEAAFAQQAGLIVNVEATRPQGGTVKLTLSLPSGFITDGFLNVCIEQSELVLSVANVFPLIATEGNLITINGQGFGDDTRDLWVGVKNETDARIVPMNVLRATDTQILARMGRVLPDFSQGTVVVARGEGHHVAPEAAQAVADSTHTVWTSSANQSASAVSVSLEDHSFYQCYYSTGNISNPWSLPVTWDDIEPPVLVLPTTLPSPAQVTINAMVHTVVGTLLGGNHIIFAGYELTLDLPAGGTPMQGAQRIADALQQAVREHSFCLSMSLEEIPGAIQMTPYFATSSSCNAGKMGWFSVCVRPAPGGVQITQVTASGTSMRIQGSGFGNETEDLSVVVLDGGGARLIPLNVVAASDTQIIARMGTVPPDALPGPVVVSRGKGSFNAPQPFFDDAMIGSAWTWLGRGTGVVSAQLVTPVPTQPETGRRWFFGEPPNSGELCIVLDGDWPSGAIVSIAAGIHDTNGAAYELNVPTVRFAQAGNPVDCAERIADVIRSGFWQQAALPVDVKATTLSAGRVKLSMSLLDGFISHGFATIGVSDPTLPAELSLRTMDRHVEVSWSGVGTLQVASNPAGSWQDVTPAPATNPHYQPTTNETKFFRLRQGL